MAKLEYCWHGTNALTANVDYTVCVADAMRICALAMSYRRTIPVIQKENRQRRIPCGNG